MEVRKLVKSGYSSLVVALPHAWIQDHGLKGGDNIFIDELNESLIISREYRKKDNVKKEIVIEIDDKSDRIVSRELVSAYINNYTYVLLKGKTIKQRAKQVKEMISGLIALELIDESSQKIVAKNFMNIEDSELKLLMRRMDNIIRSMIIDLKESLKDNSLVENIILRDREINKLNFLIFKILKLAQSDKGVLHAVGISQKDTLKYWELNGCLEKIGDRVKYIAKSVPELEKKRHPELLELLKMLEAFYVDSMVAFYEDSVEKTNAIIERQETIGKRINEFSLHKNLASSKIAVNAFNLNGLINDIGRMVRYISHD
jgi:phosphate uptake regulator